MNIKTQTKIAPFPSWNDFGLQNKNRTFLARDSKFLFHYEEEPFDSDYGELTEFPTDEYENTEEESPYRTTHQVKSKRRKINTNKYRKKRPRKEEKETELEKKYIGQPDKNKTRKKWKRKNKIDGRPDSNADWTMVSVMQSMLDFLSNPGDYFSNFQSSYVGGEGDGSFGGGGGYTGGGGGGSGYSGGGGASASNGAAPGILDGLNGIIGDTTLSRKV